MHCGCVAVTQVGYISPDLYTHSVSYFAEAPLTLFSPEALRVFVYDATARPDAKSALLQERATKAGATWRPVAALSDDALADLVRSDEVDILVELTGHTAFNRLGCLVKKPAPVQITWIGYPNSTGMREVDYRFTDSLADPADTQQEFAEALVRLPRCFLAYSPAPNPPPVAPAPGAAVGFVTFGSFNNLAKVTPAVRALWARLLREVPTARLVVKAKPFTCLAVRITPPLCSLPSHHSRRRCVDLDDRSSVISAISVISVMSYLSSPLLFRSR